MGGSDQLLLRLSSAPRKPSSTPFTRSPVQSRHLRPPSSAFYRLLSSSASSTCLRPACLEYGGLHAASRRRVLPRPSPPRPPTPDPPPPALSFSAAFGSPFSLGQVRGGANIHRPEAYYYGYHSNRQHHVLRLRLGRSAASQPFVGPCLRQLLLFSGSSLGDQFVFACLPVPYLLTLASPGVCG